MADIAELGFAVKTDGLKQGEQALDNTTKKAKALEDQAKKTGDAVSQVGNKAQGAASGVDALAKKYGVTVDQARALEARAQATNRTFDEQFKLFERGRAGIAPVVDGYQKLAPAAQAAGRAAQTTSTALQGTATAARAAAAAKQQAAISSANLAGALNTVRPAITGVGGSMAQLMPIAATAKFGIEGVALSLTGGLLVALTNAADKIDATKNKLGAVTGSFNTGAEAVDRMQRSAMQGGASVESMANSFGKLYDILTNPPSAEGVFRVGEDSAVAARKVADFEVALNRAMRSARVPTAEIEKGLQLFAQNVDELGRLTGAGLRKIAAEAPQFARVLAQSLSGGLRNARQEARFLDDLPASIDRATTALNNYDNANDKAVDPQGVKSLTDAWTGLGRAIDDTLQRAGRVGGLSGLVDDAAKRVRGATDQLFPTKDDFGSDTSRTNAGAMSNQESTFGKVLQADRTLTGNPGSDAMGQLATWLGAPQIGSGVRGAFSSIDDFFKTNSGLGSKIWDAASGDKLDELERGIEDAAKGAGVFAEQADKAGDEATQFASKADQVVESMNTLDGSLDAAADSAERMPPAFTSAGEAVQTFVTTAEEGLFTVGQAEANAAQSGEQFSARTSGAFSTAAQNAASAAQSIVAAMQSIVSAAQQAAQAVNSVPSGGGGAVDTGVGSQPYAMGGAFYGGYEITPFADGGVVTKPTLFPMADGMGLMGEAGPEAVMPLARTPEGKLGVEAVSGGSDGGSSKSDPFVSLTYAFEDAIEEQTGQLMTVEKACCAQIVEAIRSSAISVARSVESVKSRTSTGTSSDAQSEPPSLGGGLNIGARVVSGDGGGYTSGTSLAPWLLTGSTDANGTNQSGLTASGALNVGSRVVTATSGGGSSGGTNAFTDFGWNRGSFYDNEAPSYREPYPYAPAYYPISGGGSSTAKDDYAAGVGGGYIEPTAWAPTPRIIDIPQTSTGFAAGGSFIVPGAGGVDSQIVSFRTTPGERVTVENSSVSGRGVGGGVSVEGGINISLNGITRPKDWLENEAAIEARIAHTVSKALEAR